MSISSTTRKAGPYTGNGVTVAFPFNFKVFQAADLRVTLTDLSANDSDLVLTTDYTASLAVDQDATPGGTVTLVAGALATGYKLTITSKVDALQPVVLTNNGGFFPRVINDAFDRLTILIQQVIEKTSRTLTLPVSTSGISSTVPVPVAQKVLGWNDAGTALENKDPITYGLIDDAIVNGQTQRAPSQNAVYDALILKADKVALWVTDPAIGGKCDARQLLNANIPTGLNPILTATGAGFTSAVNGMVLLAPKAGATSGVTGVAGATFTCTYIDATHMQLTGTCTTAVTNGEVWFGTDDTAAFQTAVNTAAALGGGEVWFKGHTMAAGIVMPGLANVHIRSFSTGFVTNMNQINGSTNLPKYIADHGSVIHGAANSPNIPIIKMSEGLVNGIWRTATACSVQGVIIDCGGYARTGVATRGASCDAYYNTFVIRHATRYTGTMANTVYDGAWDFSVPPLNGGVYNFPSIDTADHIMINSGTVNRGSGIFQAVGYRGTGDQSAGNNAENKWFGCLFIGEDDGPYYADATCDVSGSALSNVVINAPTGRTLSQIPVGWIVAGGHFKPGTFVKTNDNAGNMTLGNRNASSTVTARSAATKIPVQFSNPFAYIELQQVDSLSSTNSQWTGFCDVHAEDSAAYPAAYVNGVVTSTASQCRSITFDKYGGFVRVFSSQTHDGNPVYATTNCSYTNMPMENLDTDLFRVGYDAQILEITQGSPGGSGIGAFIKGAKPYAAKVYLSANQTLTNATATTINWNTLAIDAARNTNGANGFWNSAAGQYLIVPPGVAWIDMDIKIAMASTSVGYVYLKMFSIDPSGTVVDYGFAVVTSTGGGSYTTISARYVKLAVRMGTRFYVQITQDSGANRDVIAGEHYSYFSMHGY